MAAVQTKNTESDEELMNQIKKRLLETGDWDRISELLRAQLEESGWDDEVKDLAKEKARAQEAPSLQGLLAEVTPKAQALVGPGIRSAVLQEIEAVLEREVEQA